MKELLPEILAALSPLLLAVIAYGAKKLADLINAKVQSEALRNILIRTDTVVFAAVKELAQVTVDSLKEAAADGKITPEEAAKVKADALAKVKSYLGQPGLDALMQILGLKDAPTVDAYLSSKIEAAVRDVKAQPNP